MANLSIRKLNDKTIEGLRFRAAEHGVSMEEEVRRILAQVVTAPGKLGDLAVKLFGQANGVEIRLQNRTTHKPLVLDN